MSQITIQQGDNLELLKQYPDNHFDSVVTDAPYGLGKEPDALKLLQDWIDHDFHEVKGKGFMGKNWDAFVPQPIFWKEVFRVIKPGGYLLCFFGTRTYDWGTMAIRLAGFEVRDCIQWIYGSGFPKSKACLKPANEPICVSRKPGPFRLLNIDGCRVEMQPGDRKGDFGDHSPEACNFKINDNNILGKGILRLTADNSCGRWPSNVIIDENISKVLDEQSGCLNNSIRKQGSIRKGDDIYFKGKVALPKESYNDKGGASRFFYVAKSSPSERNAGCEHLVKNPSKKSNKGLYYNKIIRCPEHNGIIPSGGQTYSCGCAFQYNQEDNYIIAGNFHPTIKPISLMRHLIRLVTPKGGLTLDPFAGSGTSGCASAFEGLDIVLMEAEPEYIPIIESRTKHWQKVANREKYIQELKDSQKTLF